MHHLHPSPELSQKSADLKVFSEFMSSALINYQIYVNFSEASSNFNVNIMKSFTSESEIDPIYIFQTFN